MALFDDVVSDEDYRRSKRGQSSDSLTDWIESPQGQGEIGGLIGTPPYPASETLPKSPLPPWPYGATPGGPQHFDPQGSNLIRLAGNYSFPNTEGAAEGEGERSSFEDPYSTKNVISATVTEGPNKGADVTPKPNMQNVIDWVSGNVTPESLAAGQKMTLGAARQKVDEDEAASKQGIGAMTHRMQELESIRNATAHTIADLPPKWDADKEGKDRIRGPLESFGSFASVFAIAASAFTKQPAINALTASAAAMTAIHQSDAEGYTRAYNAWKDNTDLVQKRFNMERQVFQDTSTLFEKDSTLWEAKMKANAARFNDTQMQALLEAGLWGDAFKLMDSRSLAMEHMTKGAEQFEDFNSRLRYRESLQTAAEKAHPDWTDQQKAMYKLLTLRETQPGKTEAENIVHRAAREHFERTGVPMSPEEEARLLQQARYAPGVARGNAQSVAKTAEALIKQGVPEEQAWPRAEELVAAGKEAPKTAAKLEVQEAKPKSADQEFIARFYEEHPDATEQEFSKAFQEFKRGQKPASSGTILPRSKAIQAEIDARTKKYEESGMPHEQASDKATKEVLAANAPPITGNQRQRLEMRTKNYEHSIDKINSVEKVLNNYIGAAGVAGKARRLGERLSDLAGSKKTDLVQMMRDIEYLKLEAPRLLLNADGRPLSAEAHRIDDIIGGLSAGDTTANTLRSMAELKKLYAQSKKELLGTMGAAEAPAQDTEKKPWAPPPGDKPVAQ